MVTRIFAIVGLIASVVFLAACGGGGGSDSQSSAESSQSSETTAPESSGEETAGEGGGSAALEGANLFLNPYNSETLFFHHLAEGFEAAAEEAGATAEVEYGDGTPEGQVEQLENALIRHPSLISAILIDEHSSEPVLRQAKEQGIPIIAEGSQPTNEELYATFINFNLFKLGEMKANYIAEALHGKGTVAVLTALRGLTYSEVQREGAEKTLEKYPGIKIVSAGYAEGVSADVGLAKIEDLLTREPDVEGIIFDTDGLAEGGVKAVNQAGLPKGSVLIATADGSPPGLELVESGEIAYNISECGYHNGQLFVKVAGEVLEGKEVPKEVEMKVVPFTQENIAELKKKPRTYCD